MSDQRNRDDDGPRPRVVTIEGPPAPEAEGLAPRVIATTQTGRIVPAAPVALPARPAAAPRRRMSRVSRLGVAGLATAFVGWLGVDAYQWIASAFDYGATVGWLATAAVAAGVGGAGLITARELRSFLALTSVEATQRRIAAPAEIIPPSDLQDAIRSVLAVLPKDRESEAAIAAFQRKVRAHHSPAQQLELLSRSVLAPFDRRAEAIVRRASARAFGITAISPTAVTDALFFIACAVRMVREIAGCYGHRPTVPVTAHLLRRLMVEGGKLGAIDLAAASFTQHIAGAVAERVAANAAESMYATQRMARLGLVAMELCRPVPFRPDEVPGIMSSLVGNLFVRGTPSNRDEQIADQGR